MPHRGRGRRPGCSARAGRPVPARSDRGTSRARRGGDATSSRTVMARPRGGRPRAAWREPASRAGDQRRRERGAAPRRIPRAGRLPDDVGVEATGLGSVPADQGGERPARPRDSRPAATSSQGSTNATQAAAQERGARNELAAVLQEDRPERPVAVRLPARGSSRRPRRGGGAGQGCRTSGEDARGGAHGPRPASNRNAPSSTVRTPPRALCGAALEDQDIAPRCSSAWAQGNQTRPLLRRSRPPSGD